MKLVRSVRRVALALAATLLPLAAVAQTPSYPAKPVRIIVPQGTGGSSDVISRALANELSKTLGQTVYVENKPGGGGAIGAVEAARQPADGYTLFAANAGTHVMLPMIRKNDLGYDPNYDFTPLSFVQQVPLFLVVSNELKVDTLAQFIELAKRKPGQVTVGSWGAGLTVAIANLGLDAGVNFSIVPYKGAAAALNDVVAGHINAFFDTGAAVLGQVKAGRVKLLAVATLQRLPAMPDVPTIAETYPGFESVGVNFIYAAGKIPAPIATKLSAELKKAVAAPAVAQSIHDTSGIPVNGDGEQVRRWIRDNATKWQTVVDKTGIKLE